MTAHRHKPTYFSWRSMLQRCTNHKNKSWPAYGGRGICVCKRWEFFEIFLEDMGEKPAGKSLDRIDVNGNYEPTNCRWATRDQQDANRRRGYKQTKRCGHVARGRVTMHEVVRRGARSALAFATEVRSLGIPEFRKSEMVSAYLKFCATNRMAPLSERQLLNAISFCGVDTQARHVLGSKNGVKHMHYIFRPIKVTTKPSRKLSEGPSAEIMLSFGG